MLIVFLALPTFLQIYPKFLKPKPETRPEGQIGWPLYFVGYAFVNNRKFGSLFMFGLLIDVLYAFSRTPRTSGAKIDIIQHIKQSSFHHRSWLSELG